MPRVTGVRAKGGRVRVFLDGEFWAELEANFAAESGILEGAELSETELEEVRRAGERALAMDRALGLLGYRARSEAEILRRLKEAGYAAGTVEEVIGRLEDLGYLDDEQFARQFARQKSGRYGPRRLQAELRKSGVDEGVARDAVEEEFSGRSEPAEAREAARRRYNNGEKSDTTARRVYGFLARRGYSAGVCAEVAREYRP